MSEMVFNRARPGSDIDVFMSYVQFEPNSGCWLWTGPLAGKMGYGRFFRHGLQHQAHKWIYERTRGLIGKQCALHRCDTAVCVNPDHIFLGSLADNNHDRTAKQRSARGEQNGQARLTAEAAAIIRSSHERTSVLAARFRVHAATIKRVRRGDYWRA